MARDKDDDGGGFSGKRNKSWREIDAMGGKTKGLNSAAKARHKTRVVTMARY